MADPWEQDTIVGEPEPEWASDPVVQAATTVAEPPIKQNVPQRTSAPLPEQVVASNAPDAPEGSPGYQDQLTKFQNVPRESIAAPETIGQAYKEGGAFNAAGALVDKFLGMVPLGSIPDQPGMETKLAQAGGEKINPAPHVFGHYEINPSDSPLVRNSKSYFNAASDLLGGLVQPENIALMVATVGMEAPGIAANEILKRQLLKAGEAAAAGGFGEQNLQQAADLLHRAAAMPDGPEKSQLQAQGLTQLVAGSGLVAGAGIASSKIGKPAEIISPKPEEGGTQASPAAVPPTSPIPVATEGAPLEAVKTPEPVSQGIVNEVKQSEAQPVSEGGQGQAASSSAPKASPSDFTPALRTKDGTIIPGEKGRVHQDIYDAQGDPTELRASDPEHIFLDKEGKPVTREQVSSALGETDPMQSERLIELQKAEQGTGTSGTAQSGGVVLGESDGAQTPNVAPKVPAGQPKTREATFFDTGKPETTKAIEQPKVTADEPVISEIANRYSRARSDSGDLGDIAPGVGASAEEMAGRGRKLVEGGADVDAAVTRIMDGKYDPVDDSAVARFEEARLRNVKDKAYRELQNNPDGIEAKQTYENAFNDLTDFHKGPIAKIKVDWHKGGVNLQGQFPVDLSTADGLREAWLQATGKDAPESVRPLMERTANRVKSAVDKEVDVNNRLTEAIDKEVVRQKSPKADAVRERILKELENRPCR